MFDLRQNSWPTTTRQYPAQFDCLWVGQPWPSLDLQQQQQQQQQLACYVQSASLTDWVNYWRRLFAPSCNIRPWITVGQVTAAAWHFDDDDPNQVIAKLKKNSNTRHICTPMSVVSERWLTKLCQAASTSHNEGGYASKSIVCVYVSFCLLLLAISY